jgi:serine phosphatase RsbU (regulator of sigma subunit)
MSALPPRTEAARLRELFDRLDRETARCRALARSWQRSAIPAAGPFAFDVAHVAVGHGSGDSFDAVPLADGRLAVYLADCGGPATPSGCLIGLGVRLAIATAALQPAISPGGLLAAVNRALLATGDGHAVAMAVAILDVASDSIELARAALPPPAVVDAAGTVSSWPLPGPPLGLAPAEFPSADVPFAGGSRLILSSLDAIATHAGTAEAMLQSIPPADRPGDDRTVLVVSRGA